MKPRPARPLFLFLAITLTACHPSGRTAIDRTLAGLLPPDSTMLAGIRMDAVRATPLFQKLVAGRSWPQLERFAHETGLDPRRDVREWLMASDGKNLLIAARGTFREQSFAGLAQQSYQGYRLYTHGEHGVALIDASTAVAGTLPAVRAALDRDRSGGGYAPAELLARARQIPSQNQVWSVSNGLDNLLTSGIPETGNAANVGRILRSLENTTIAIDLRNGIIGYLTGTCPTEQEARDVADSARGLIGLARLGVSGKQPELLRLWDGIQVEQQQRTVTITVAEPEDLVDKMLELLGVR